MRLPVSDRLQCNSSLLLSRAVVLSVMILATALLSGRAFAQGETTSAIVGQVTDATHAAVAGPR